MDNKKKAKAKAKANANRVAAYALSGVMLASMIPYNVFANMTGTEKAALIGAEELNISTPQTRDALRSSKTEEALPKNREKEINWNEALKEDERNWPVDIAGGQRLLRVTTSDPVKLTDINYDGSFVDGEGNTVIRLTYREYTGSVSAVWHRMLMRFDEDLYNNIDWEKSYAVTKSDEKIGFINQNTKNEKLLDIKTMRGATGDSRRNLPINLVLKDKKTIKDLGEKNYLVQMRLMDEKLQRIYAIAPKGKAMDYSTYTKAASIPLGNEADSVFLKGGPADQQYTYARQNSFFTEFIANPTEFADSSNVGIIRTQYLGIRSALSDPKDFLDNKPGSFVQIFDAALVPYLKEDANKNIAFTNVLNANRDVFKDRRARVGIKKSDINYVKDENGNNKLAYVVFVTDKFKNPANSNIPNVKTIKVHNDNFWGILNLNDVYVTAVDYMVDKAKFVETFSTSGKNKVDFPLMTGWADSNPNGWTVYEKDIKKDAVIPAGQQLYIDIPNKPKDAKLVLQIGDEEDSILRREQGYYNAGGSSTDGLDGFKELAKNSGVYS